MEQLLNACTAAGAELQGWAQLRANALPHPMHPAPAPPLRVALWPEGRGNVAYGANVGSNHTGKLADQEAVPGCVG